MSAWNVGFHTHTRTRPTAHASTLSWTWWMSLLPFASHHHSVCSKEKNGESTSYCSHFTSLFLPFILVLLSSGSLFHLPHHLLYTWWALTDWLTPSSINTPKLVSSIAVLYCDFTLASPWKDNFFSGFILLLTSPSITQCSTVDLFLYNSLPQLLKFQPLPSILWKYHYVLVTVTSNTTGVP